jgi:riboflavin synthase
VTLQQSVAKSPAGSSLSVVFTGIVRERGRVVSVGDGRLVVQSTLQPGTGDSIAVDGVCLTVTERENGRLAFDVMAETVARAKPFGPEVNLEPAVRAGEPLGGHYVQGHVDGVGRVRSVDGERLAIEAPPSVLRYCVEKGSIAVDGVSLTIASLHEDSFEVALVSHTLGRTTLGSLEPGDPVNLEADVLAKYVERLLGASVSTLPLDRSVQTDHRQSP